MLGNCSRTSTWKLGPLRDGLELLTREPSTRSSLGGRQRRLGWAGAPAAGGGEQVLLEEPLLEVSSLGPPQTPLLAVGGWIWVCRGDLGQYGCLLACHPRSPLGCAPRERIQLCSLRGGCVGPCGGLLHPGGLRCCPMVPYEQVLLRAKQVQGGIAPSIINRGCESPGEKRALSARGPEGTMWEGRGERAAGLEDAQRGLQPAEP